MTAAAPARPGRQRSQAADEAIVTATLALLRETGYRGLTMSAVIERAGVSSATLYRRWPTKQALVAVALRTLTAAPAPADTGSLAADVDALVRSIARAIVDRSDLFAGLAVELQFDDELRALSRTVLVEPRLRQVEALLNRAVARGELDARNDPTMVLSLLAGPIHHRVFVLGERPTPAFLRSVVRHVVGGLGPASPG